MKGVLFRGIVLAGICLASCGDQDSNQAQSNSEEHQSIKEDVKVPLPTQFAYEIHSSEEGFGYSISSKGKKMIIQDYIPCIQGRKAFRTEEDAKKVAELMIEKMENNIMPPSVTESELHQLGIEID